MNSMNKTENPRLLKLLNALLVEVTRSVDTTLKYLNQTISKKPDTKIGMKIAVLAMWRLNQSFRAAKPLLRRGYTFEVVGIYRLIFEQLAWVYTIHKESAISHIKVTPTKCVNRFKQVFKVGGRIYGDLSDLAHLNPKYLMGYLRIQHEENYVQLEVVRAGIADIIQQSLVLLLLAYLYGALAEFMNKGRNRKLRFLKNDGNTFDLSLKRLYKLKSYQEKLDRLKRQKPEESKLRLVYFRPSVSTNTER